MRKRFVRLAIVAVVVLIAFMMYRSTEGFVNTLDMKCAPNSKGIKAGNGYVCVNTSSANKTYNKLKTNNPPRCGNSSFSNASDWKLCKSPLGVEPAYTLANVSNATKTFCYTCTK